MGIYVRGDQPIDDVTIERSTFADLGADGIQAADTGRQVTNLTIRNNVFTGHVRRSPPYDWDGGENAVDIKAARGPVTVEGNTIRGFRACRAGFECSGSPGTGMVVHEGTHGRPGEVRIIGNTFLDNHVTGLAVNYATGPVFVLGNVFRGNAERHLAMTGVDSCVVSSNAYGTLASVDVPRRCTSAGFSGISVHAESSVINWGDTVQIRAHFGINGAAKRVMLQASRDAVNFVTIGVLTTDGDGDASLAYRPATNLYYRALFAGAPDLQPGVTAPMRVVVRQLLVVRPLNVGRIKRVDRGDVVTFTGTVRPNRPDLVPPVVDFVVYKLVGGTWTQIVHRRVTADGDGVATFRMAFTSAASYYVRSMAVPTPYNANTAWSVVDRYVVP